VKPGTFIISLDCEGKWGVADRVDAAVDRAFTDENLLDAYHRLDGLFAEYSIPATFAFVSAFTFSPRELALYEELLDDVVISGGNWLRHYRRQRAEGGAQGWFLPQALDLIDRSGRHEIASHGFSHLPVGDPMVSADAAAHEFATARQVAQDRGREVHTYIYPRNLVAHRDRLTDAGFIGFRGARPGTGRGLTARAGTLLSELNVFQKADPSGSDPAEIPAGHFFNWRAGLRRRIPPVVTRARWKAMLNDASRSDRVCHLWLHPHNLIGDGGTFDVLRSVMREAALLREAGKLDIMTQYAYLESR